MRLIPGLLLLILAGCELFQPPAAPPKPPWPELRASDFGAMRNVSKCGDVWLGGGVTLEDVELAYRRGVKSILDLSFPGEGPDFDLGRACSEQDKEKNQEPEINHYEAGLLGPDALTDRNADFALDLFRDQEQRPLLVVCGSGSNSATFFALWRVLDHEMPLEEALEEARRAGMRPGPLAAYVEGQVARLREKEE